MRYAYNKHLAVEKKKTGQSQQVYHTEALLLRKSDKNCQNSRPAEADPYMYICMYDKVKLTITFTFPVKGWLAIAKLKPHSLFIHLLSTLKKAFYNVNIEK